MEENQELAETEISVNPQADKIENELAELYKTGKTKYDIEELQSSSPELYDLLFDTYEPDEDNGVVTTRYKLTERTDGYFYLIKK